MAKMADKEYEEITLDFLEEEPEEDCDSSNELPKIIIDNPPLTEDKNRQGFGIVDNQYEREPKVEKKKNQDDGFYDFQDWLMMAYAFSEDEEKDMDLYD
jgi:hypothetical protein